MLGGILLMVLFFAASIPLLQMMKRRKPWFQLGMMKNLYWFHCLFTIIYYVFQLNSRSDSQEYFLRPQYNYPDWLSAYDTGTPFIDFVSYPFINYLGFSFEMMYVLFAWMGFWGFVFFYVYIKENLKYRHKLWNIDLIAILIFLPNMHFWTASLGKGSIIFLGLGMAMYGLSQLKTRKVYLLFGLLIVYHVRPHVFLFMAVGIVVGMFTGRQKVPLWQKLFVFGASVGAMVLLYDKIMAFSKIDGDNVLQSFNQFSSSRSYELSKSAGSGIDISNYPLVLKLFTFWFRPLFIDSPGAMGLVVSVENMLCLYLAFQLCRKEFIKFFRKSSALVKTSAVTFLATSFALSNTLSNMGIITRQKSMIMYFLLFVILSFMDYKKHLQVMKRQRRMQAREEAPPVTEAKLAVASRS